MPEPPPFLPHAPPPPRPRVLWALRRDLSALHLPGARTQG